MPVAVAANLIAVSNTDSSVGYTTVSEPPNEFFSTISILSPIFKLDLSISLLRVNDKVSPKFKISYVELVLYIQEFANICL